MLLKNIVKIILMKLKAQDESYTLLILYLYDPVLLNVGQHKIV